MSENRCKRTEVHSGMSELTKEGASQDVAGGLDGWMEMVLVDVVIGWRLSINLRERELVYEPCWDTPRHK